MKGQFPLETRNQAATHIRDRPTRYSIILLADFEKAVSPIVLVYIEKGSVEGEGLMPICMSLDAKESVEVSLAS